MAVNFPQNPEIGDTFEAADLLYTWDGTRWLSAFTPGLDYKGPKGDSGSTGATGPEPTQITVTESLDEDLNFSIPFVSGTSGTGITTVFKDTGGIVFNPFINLFNCQQVETENLVADIANVNDVNVRFVNPGSEREEGTNASGLFGDITINTPGAACTVLSIDVTGNAMTEINMVGQVRGTGDMVTAKYHMFASNGPNGFEVTSAQYITEAIPNPIDQPIASNGFVTNSELGVFYSRNSTNNKFINFGFYTKNAGTYVVDWKIGRNIVYLPS